MKNTKNSLHINNISEKTQKMKKHKKKYFEKTQKKVFT